MDFPSKNNFHFLHFKHAFTTRSDVGAKPLIAQNKVDGFTLIELLVVIAIIGLLSSVVLASLSGARESARDSRRLQDIKQIQTALEIYHNDNSQYPDAPPTGENWSSGCANGSWNNGLGNELEPYMSGGVPVPPGSNDTGQDCYFYQVNKVFSSDDPKCTSSNSLQSYILVFYAEKKEFDFPIQNANGTDERVGYCIPSS